MAKHQISSYERVLAWRKPHAAPSFRNRFLAVAAQIEGVREG